MCSDAHTVPHSIPTDCIAYANVSEFKIFQVMMFSHFCSKDAGVMRKLRATEWEIAIIECYSEIRRDVKRMSRLSIHSATPLSKTGLLVFWNGSFFHCLTLSGTFIYIYEKYLATICAYFHNFPNKNLIILKNQFEHAKRLPCRQPYTIQPLLNQTSCTK